MNTRKLLTRSLSVATITLLLAGCASGTEHDPLPLDNETTMAPADTAETALDKHTPPETSQPATPQPATSATSEDTTIPEPTIPDPTCDTGTFYDPEAPAGISNYGAKPDMYRITDPVTVDDVTGPTTVRMPVKGTMTTVTLLGVNPGDDTDAARQHLKNLIGNQKVILEYEPTQGVTNDNGETQGYLWIAGSDGKPTVLLNTTMIAEKYGTPAESTGHAPHRLSDSFTAATNN